MSFVSAASVVKPDVPQVLLPLPTPLQLQPCPKGYTPTHTHTYVQNNAFIA